MMIKPAQARILLATRRCLAVSSVAATSPGGGGAAAGAIHKKKKICGKDGNNSNNNSNEEEEEEEITRGPRPSQMALSAVSSTTSGGIVESIEPKFGDCLLRLLAPPSLLLSSSTSSSFARQLNAGEPLGPLRRERLFKIDDCWLEMRKDENDPSNDAAVVITIHHGGDENPSSSSENEDDKKKRKEMSTSPGSFFTLSKKVPLAHSPVCPMASLHDLHHHLPGIDDNKNPKEKEGEKSQSPSHHRNDSHPDDTVVFFAQKRNKQNHNNNNNDPKSTTTTTTAPSLSGGGGGDTSIRIAAGVLLESSDGKVLLTQRPPHMRIFPSTWVVPGGGVDQGEGFVQAAARELLEETGISLPLSSLSPLVMWESTYPAALTEGAPKRQHLIVYFLAKLSENNGNNDNNDKNNNAILEHESGKVHLLLPKEEVSGAVWLSPEDVFRLDLSLMRGVEEEEEEEGTVAAAAVEEAEDLLVDGVRVVETIESANNGGENNNQGEKSGNAAAETTSPSSSTHPTPSTTKLVPAKFGLRGVIGPNVSVATQFVLEVWAKEKRKQEREREKKGKETERDTA